MTPTTEDILHRLLNGELSSQEISLLRNDPEWIPQLRIIDELDSWSVPEGPSHEAAWNRLMAKLDGRQAPVRRLLPWIWVGAAAAVFAILFLLFGTQETETATNWLTQAGETQQVLLNDGSQVTLGAGSSLSVIGDWKQSRRLQLQGAAMFEVSKGKPFVVESSLGEVKVLGTRFEVIAAEEHYVVHCFEGVVAISSHNAHFDTLHAGEGARLISQGWQSLLIEEQEPSWMTGTTQFVSTPLSEVLTAFERQFGVTFVYESDDRLYTGAIPHHDESQALDLILVPMGLEMLSREGQTIRLKKLSE